VGPRRAFAAVGLVALLVAAIALVAFRTAQIKQDPAALLR
jgi:hypothetical protein